MPSSERQLVLFWFSKMIGLISNSYSLHQSTVNVKARAGRSGLDFGHLFTVQSVHPQDWWHKHTHQQSDTNQVTNMLATPACFLRDIFRNWWKPDYVIMIKEWFEFFLFSIFLCLCHMSPCLQLIHQLKREDVCDCVCVCVCRGGVCGSFRKISSSSKHSAVQCKTFCHGWAYGVSHWVGSTLDNWQFSIVLAMHCSPAGVLVNPLVPRVKKIKIRKLALTDFYWLKL